MRQVLHRSGLQFFEVASYAIATGLVALVVFRGLLQRPFGAVWDFPAEFPEVDYRHVILGAGFWQAMRHIGGQHLPDSVLALATEVLAHV